MTKMRSSTGPTFAQEAIRYVYSFLLMLLIPFAFFNFLFRKKNKETTAVHGRFERLGFVKAPPKKAGYLFHCVSVGEVVAASALIKPILKKEPEASVTVTTTTATGSARVKAIFGDAVHHFYLPYDLPWAMNRMLGRIAPKMVLITEVELWPNLIHSCWRRKIPVVVINARMSEGSANRYSKISLLFAPMLMKVSHVCAQGQRDYDNYLALGIEKSKLTLTNNIKFDQSSATLASTDSFHGLVKNERPILIGGSTHEGEERALLDGFITLKATFPTLMLILVPRHPERFNTVRKLIESESLHVASTSDTPVIALNTDVVLVDEMGKLDRAYGVATIAFVGGSLADKGGHNALEPAAHKLPIVMGPHIYNNPVICDSLIEKGALVIVNDTQALIAQCRHYLQNPGQALQAGLCGYEVLMANKGAVLASMAVINKY